MLLQDLEKKKLISCPKWLPLNCMYLTEMGSNAYGVSSGNSDLDIYGFCVPPKDMVFPHLRGEIPGFGEQIKRFEVWQEHHVKEHPREYDFCIYSIVKYFQLCMGNNPNMVDSMFVKRRSIRHSTAMSEMVREKRHMFLHKGSFHAFRGYAYSNLHKAKQRLNNPMLDKLLAFEDEYLNSDHSISLETVKMELSNRNILVNLTEDQIKTYYDLYVKTIESNKRLEDVKVKGYDSKHLYHVIRLIDEAEQILEYHDLDLERSREMLKSVRRGDWSMQQIVQYFEDKERYLEQLYSISTLRHSPDEKAIKTLLLECLEMHYGTISTMLNVQPEMSLLINDLQAVLERYSK